MVARHHPLRPSAIAGNSHLTELGREFGRSRSRERRLWRTYQRVDDMSDRVASTAAHRAWSDAVDDTLIIADAMSRERASDLDELCLQFDAIWWWIAMDDNVIDSSTRRWLQRFRHSLRRLAGNN